jgi:hypothetical protein
MAEDVSDGRATTQTLDRRVERLEGGLAETQRTVDRLQLGQEHLRELVSARFTSIESGQATTNAKIDSLSSYLNQLVTAAQHEQLNWKESAAGKELTSDLASLQADKEATAARVAKAERQLYAMSIVLGILVIIANILGPVIAKNIIAG